MTAAYASFADAFDFDGGSVSVTKPSGTADGDYLVCFAFRYEDGGNSGVGFTMSGWTDQGTVFAGLWRMRVFTRVAGASEPSSYTVSYGTPGDGYGAQAIILRTTGVDTSSPIDVGPTFASSVASTSTVTAPSVSPSGSDSLLLCMFLFQEDFTDRTLTAPGGMTLVSTYPAVGGYADAAAGYEGLTASGATGTRVATVSSGTVSTEIGASIALRSAGGGATVTGTAAVALGGLSASASAMPVGTGAAPLGSLTAAATGLRTVHGTAAATLGALDAAADGVPTTYGTAAATLGGLSASADVIGRAFFGTLEIEFTASTWTDVTDRLMLSRQPLKIVQGRRTQFDDVGAATLTCLLRNHDAELMPDNSSSSYYPNVVEGKRIRWRVTQSGNVYTRFIGWITAIQPKFPGSDIRKATVTITAQDALGRLAQRYMRSNFAEIALWLARDESVQADVYEAAGNGTLMTNFSQDASPGAPSTSFVADWPTLSVGTDGEMSIGGIITANSGSEGLSCKTICGIQTGALQIIIHMKTPTSLLAAGTWFCASFNTDVGAPVCHLAMAVNGSSNALFLMDSAGTTNLGIVSNLPFGQWVKIRVRQNASTASHLDVASIEFGGSATGLSDASLDIRTIGEIELPGSTGLLASASWGGIAALGTRTDMAWDDGWSAGYGRSIGNRAASLADATDDLPVSWVAVGSMSLDALTGSYDGLTALQVGQRLVRSERGILWARSKDSALLLVAAASCRPASPVTTIDLEEDCDGPPDLERAVESTPTRVEVSTPGGTVLVVDTTAEAGPGLPQRLEKIQTVNADLADASDLADLLLSSTTRKLRISQVRLDLARSITDHVGLLFTESTSLGGLYPTQRIRLAVPSAFFGAATVDVYVQGWEESYTEDNAYLTFDTTPAS
jgi:hypothetical protein